MRLGSQTWQQKLHQEINFLPKRLVLLLFLLLVFYLILIIRTELRQIARRGLVEVPLQSRLTADYEATASQQSAFAPLSLAVVEAKIRDKNPYLSEAEVMTLVQTAIAAAHAPIITATPTPGPLSNAVIQAVSVVNRGVGTAPSDATAVALRGTVQPTDMATVAIPTAVRVSPTPLPAAVGSTQGQESNGPLVVGGKPTVTPGNTPTSTILPTVTSLPPQMLATVIPTPTVLDATQANPRPSTTATPLATATAAVPRNTPTQQIPAPEVTTTTSPPTVPTATAPPTPTATWSATPAATSTIVSISLSASLASTATPSATPSSLPTVTATPTLTPTVGVPPAILNLTAQVKADQVYLTWSPSFASGVVGYNLYRSRSESVTDGQLVNAQPVADTAYIDSVVMDGSQTFYVVTAVNQFNQESPPSKVVIAQLPDHIPPQTLMNFSVRLTGASVQLQWQASSAADLAGYKIYRSTQLPIDLNQGPLNSAALLQTPAYQDTIVLNGATYYYVFTAVDLSGNESFPSIEAQIPTIDLEAPAPPTGLTVTAQKGLALIQWQTSREPDIAGYRLYRSRALPVDTSTPLHSEALLTELQYWDNNLQPNQTYYYLLVAVDGYQNTSVPSDPVALVMP